MPATSNESVPAAKTAAVIGGGPAGLIATEMLAQSGLSVTVYDQMASVGRKFLLAGRGGLNLTHSEEIGAFLARYGDLAPQLRQAIETFPPSALRAWSDGLGQPTFVGSSGRVFPSTLKTSPLLRAWLKRLADLKVTFAPRHRWTGWDEAGQLRFEHNDGEVLAAPDVTILALGGGSWPKLGSDGIWTEFLAARGIAIAPLRPSNCGFTVDWTDKFRAFEGQPLKPLTVSFDGRIVRGELMVTRDGLEGGAIYALSGPLRAAIDKTGKATVTIDLSPDLSAAALTEKLNLPRASNRCPMFCVRAPA